MRDNLKKIVDGAEALLQLLGNILFYILMSPFFLIVWVIAIFRILYNYSKHPSVTFEECVRYNFTYDTNDDLFKVEPKGFIDLFYIPRREFDLEEYKKVKSIIENS
jgi:hypothetical protein